MSTCSFRTPTSTLIVLPCRTALGCAALCASTPITAIFAQIESASRGDGGTANADYRVLCMAVVGLGVFGRRSLRAAGRATRAQNQPHPDADAGRVRRQRWHPARESLLAAEGVPDHRIKAMAFPARYAREHRAQILSRRRGFGLLRLSSLLSERSSGYLIFGAKETPPC